MMLSEYIKNLQDVLKDIGDLHVIYASDDEGNNYQKVCFPPSVGNFDGEYDGEYDGEFVNSNSDDFDDDREINAVCVN